MGVTWDVEMTGTFSRMVRAARKKLCETNFLDFVQQAWPHINPSRLVMGEHVSALCDHLQAMTTGETVNGVTVGKRLLVNLPPRHSKSYITDVMWPAWCWGPLARPHLMFQFGCYDHTILASNMSIYCRDLIQTDWYQDNWSNVNPSADQFEKAFWRLHAGGGYRCIGPGTKTTGMGGHVNVFDDPHNVQKAESKADRDNAIKWWLEAMTFRIEGPPEDVLWVVVAQRTNVQDISGLLIDRGLYDHLCLPAIAERDHPHKSTTGYVDPREPGEALWPERFSSLALGEADFLDTYGRDAQLQQRPSPRGGSAFKTAWFQYYEIQDTHPEDPRSGYYVCGPDRILRSKCRVVMFCDTAETVKSYSDYSAIGVWVIHWPHVMLLHISRKKLEPEELMKEVRDIANKYHPTTIGIGEDAITLIRLLRRPIDGARALPIKKLSEKGDKYEKSRDVRNLYELGHIWHPKGAKWLKDYEGELCAFSAEGTHAYDDQVDITSHLGKHVSADVYHSGNMRKEMEKIGSGGTQRPVTARDMVAGVRQIW